MFHSWSGAMARLPMYRLQVVFTRSALFLACCLNVSCSERLDQPSTSYLKIPPTQNIIRVSLDSALWRIGEDSTSELVQFGLVWSGVLLADGASAITDMKTKRAITISSDGRHIAVLGRSGEGPMEIREPSVILSSEGHSLILIDNALHRLTNYLVTGNSFQFVNSSEFTTQPLYLCETASGFVMLKVVKLSNKILHHLDRHGRITKSFAPLLFPDSMEIFNFVLTKGPILCDREGTTTVAALRTGDLIAYRPDGSVLWRQIPEGYLPMGIIWLGSAVGWDVVPGPDFRSTPIREFHRLNDTLALLQMGVFARREPRGPSYIKSIDSRIYDLRTGAEVGRQRDLPEIFALRDGQALIKGEKDDVPWVEKRDYRLLAVGRKLP